MLSLYFATRQSALPRTVAAAVGSHFHNTTRHAKMYSLYLSVPNRARSIRRCSQVSIGRPIAKLIHQLPWPHPKPPSVPKKRLQGQCRVTAPQFEM